MTEFQPSSQEVIVKKQLWNF